MSLRTKPLTWCLLFAATALIGVACESPPEGAATAETAASVPAPGPTASGAKGLTSGNPLALDLRTSASAQPDAPPAPVSSADLKTVLALEKIAKNGVLPGREADAFAKPGDPPKVVVLEPGAAPLENLSYEFATSAKETSVMHLDMAVKMDMGKGAQSIPIPTIVMTFDLATGPSRAANGDVAVSGTVTSVNVKPSDDPVQKKAAEEMKKALAGITGMTMSYSVSAKGRSRDTKVNVPAGAPEDAKKIVEQMRHSLESMAAPLPDEKVGVGGKWLVVTRVSSGADILQWTTYALKSKNGTKIELEAVVKQLAATGTMSGGQMPAGFEAKITNFQSGGTSLTNMDLTKLSPEKGTGEVRSIMSFSAQNQSMTVDMAMKLVFSRK